MGKMHELLAVEKDMVGKTKAILDETLKTFKDKAVEFYTARIKTYKPFNEDDKDLLPVEQKELVDTVPSKLAYTFNKVAQEYDWLLQKEATNQIAKADLIVDGVTIGLGLPATFLLSLEHRLERIRDLVLHAPTLPNGFKWVKDEQKGADVFTLDKPLVTYRTRKVSVPFVLSPATDKHPAQVQKDERTETIGSYTETYWDTRVTSSYKADILERVDKVLIAVRKAIRKANDVEASNSTVGGKMFEFILRGK